MEVQASKVISEDKVDEERGTVEAAEEVGLVPASIPPPPALGSIPPPPAGVPMPPSFAPIGTVVAADGSPVSTPFNHRGRRFRQVFVDVSNHLNSIFEVHTIF